MARWEFGYSRQHAIELRYRGHVIAGHKLDLPIERRLVVELKAVDQLINIHTAQVLSYLKAMDSHLGLLINFNVPLLKNGIRRVVRTTDPRRRGVVAVQS